MTTMELIKIAIIALIVFVLIILYIINCLKNKEKIKLLDILRNIPKYMEMAEQQFNSMVSTANKKTGQQKLEYVKDKVKIDCLSANIEYDETVVTNEVEEFTNFSKKVNSK